MRRTLNLSVLEGCFALLPFTFSTGVFLTGFMLLLNADAWAFGLVTAITALGQAFQVAAAALLVRGERRKRLTVWGASLARYLWLPMALLPFAPLTDTLRLTLFFGLLATATALANMANVAWTSWMGDLVPDGIRGRYFGFRNAVNAVAAMLSVWTGSLLMSAFKAGGQEAWGFLWLTGIAMAGAVASQLALQRQAPPPSLADRPMTSPWRALQAPLHDRRFRNLACALAVWALVANITGGFCYPYAMKRLGLSYDALALHAMIITAISVFSQLAWGRIIDRIGARRALVFAMLPVTLHPLIWLCMSPRFTAPIWLDAVSSGCFWPGITLATFALLLERAPRGMQAPYTSFGNALAGLATGLGALIGGALLTRMGDAIFTIGGVGLVAMQVLLLPCTALRLACVGLLVRADSRQPTLTIDVRAVANPPGNFTHKQNEWQEVG